MVNLDCGWLVVAGGWGPRLISAVAVVAGSLDGAGAVPSARVDLARGLQVEWSGRGLRTHTHRRPVMDNISSSTRSRDLSQQKLCGWNGQPPSGQCELISYSRVSQPTTAGWRGALPTMAKCVAKSLGWPTVRRAVLPLSSAQGQHADIESRFHSNPLEDFARYLWCEVLHLGLGQYSRSRTARPSCRSTPVKSVVTYEDI